MEVLPWRREDQGHDTPQGSMRPRRSSDCPAGSQAAASPAQALARELQEKLRYRPWRPFAWPRSKPHRSAGAHAHEDDRVQRRPQPAPTRQPHSRICAGSATQAASMRHGPTAPHDPATIESWKHVAPTRTKVQDWGADASSSSGLPSEFNTGLEWHDQLQRVRLG